MERNSGDKRIRCRWTALVATLCSDMVTGTTTAVSRVSIFHYQQTEEY